ncbi:MAG: hypothetical protein LBC19_01160 [Tannerella sp.]|nr:hypothetical protein [Tannerella sp.]
MVRLKVYFLILISCVCMNNAFSQGFLAANTGEYREKSDVVSAEAEGNSDYKWEFFSAVSDSFDDAVLLNAEKNEFGQRVACLKMLVNKYYICKEEVVPGDPTMRTLIRKPDIYNSVRRVEKHLKKEVKKGNLTWQQAADELTFVLEVAVAAIDEKDTDSFEASLGESKNSANAQIKVFKQVKLNRFY